MTQTTGVRIFTSSKTGKTVEVSWTDTDAVKAIEKTATDFAGGNLPISEIRILNPVLASKTGSTISFILSLCKNFRTRGSRSDSLSSEQWFWVHTWYDRIQKAYEAAENEDHEKLATATDQKPAEIVQVPEFPRICEMFSLASADLKKPSIQFNDIGGFTTFYLTFFTMQSQVFGSIGVYVNRVYSGRIDNHSHRFLKKESINRELEEKILETLGKIESDPSGFAAEYGKKSGSCCFCGIQLTDPRSLNVGYGPVCADHYGLPWGDTEDKKEKKKKGNEKQ